MASVQFIDVQARPTEFQDVTSLTLDALPQLVPPLAAAQAPMVVWRLAGLPRTARQCSVYKNCLSLPETHPPLSSYSDAP